MLYEDVNFGLNQEIKLFQSYFEDEIDIISIHRPNEDFLKNPENFFTIHNSYEKRFTKDNISYYADSRGSFRFGDPLDSDCFKENKNIQLLTHPVWWMTGEKNISSCVDKVISNKEDELRNYFKKNITTFKV